MDIFKALLVTVASRGSMRRLCKPASPFRYFHPSPMARLDEIARTPSWSIYSDGGRENATTWSPGEVCMYIWPPAAITTYWRPVLRDT